MTQKSTKIGSILGVGKSESCQRQTFPQVLNPILNGRLFDWDPPDLLQFCEKNRSYARTGSLGHRFFTEK